MKEPTMSHHRLFRPLIVAGLAALVITGLAEAIVGPEYHFAIFGVVNGVQVARLNVVLSPPPDTDLPCSVTLAFIDSQDRLLGGPDTFPVRGGEAVHTDFTGDSNGRVGDRLPIRATVMVHDSESLPGCAGKTVLASVEVIDRLTHATHVILTNPVKVEPPAVR
jgi:hypothetical protein